MEQSVGGYTSLFKKYRYPQLSTYQILGIITLQFPIEFRTLILHYQLLCILVAVVFALDRAGLARNA